jgi:hypothetical protein
VLALVGVGLVAIAIAVARRGTGGDSGPAVPPDGSAAAVETPVGGADQAVPPPAAGVLPVAGDVPPAAEGWPDIAAAGVSATVAPEASDPDHVPEDPVDHV